MEKNMTGLKDDRRTEQDQMITDIENRESDLTEWEADFMQSIREQFDSGYFLTEKQLAIVDRIWERVT